MAESGTSEALRLLIAQRDRLNRAIATLQEASEEKPRRGRPPGSKNAKKVTKRRGRRSPMSDAEKRAASERMKKHWAKRRKAAKKSKS